LNESEVIERFLVEELEIDNADGHIDPGQDLLAAGLLDSMSITQIVVFLEDQFGTDIKDEDLIAENFSSIDAMAALVGGKG